MSEQRFPTERLSPDASSALHRAQYEARQLQHNYLGQEHLLVGLLHDTRNTATRALTEAGLDPETVRAIYDAVMGRGQQPPPEGEPLEFAPRLTRAMDLAVDEARRLNHYDVGTGHLLIGLIREGSGMATQMLSRTDVAPEALREAAVALLEADTTREPRLRRYQLTLPNHLFEGVEWIARREDVTLLEVLRRFVKLGLLVDEINERKDASLVIREAGGSRARAPPDLTRRRPPAASLRSSGRAARTHVPHGSSTSSPSPPTAIHALGR